MSAYTQGKEEASKFLRIPKSECPDVWIRLPRHKWPNSWSNTEDPVVPLERNLYTAPLVARIFLTTGSLSSCSRLFEIVSQHARTSLSFSYTFHNAHALVQVGEYRVAGCHL